MKYSFHPLARDELFEVIGYYESCSVGLGVEFAGEVYSAIQRILEFPDAWSRLSKTTRRCLLNRFPFGLIYQVIDDEIVIVAVMQLSREPDYWDKRIK